MSKSRRNPRRSSSRPLQPRRRHLGWSLGRLEFETLEHRWMLDSSDMLNLLPTHDIHESAPTALVAPLMDSVNQSSAMGPTGDGSLSPLVSSNILVNNPTLDGVSTSDTQSETSLINFGSTIIVSFNDSHSNVVNSSKFTGYAVSTDGGQTFTDKGELPTNASFGDAGDPVLARDAVSGQIYFATLGFLNANSIPVFRSSDGGQTFGAPINGAPGIAGGNLDKEWMAVDNSSGAGQGNVYLVVRDFGSTGSIRFFRSTDQGTTWGPSGGTQIVSQGANNVQGAYVAVAPDHSVDVFWYDQSAGAGTIATLKMRRSTDLGVTFGAAVTVATLTSTASNGDLGLGFRTNAFPHVTINPVSGAIYVTYNDRGAGADRGDIYFTQSLNNGTTWSSPVRVNDDATTRDQWQPSIAVKPNGTQLFIGFYDRRLDAANSLIDTFGAIGDINASTGAVIFEPNFRLTTASFPTVYGVDPKINSVYMGDYDTAGADNSNFYYSWADNRDSSPGRGGNQANVRFATITTSLNVVSSTPTNGAVVSTPPNDFVISFSQAYDSSTVNASDLTVNGVAADSFVLTSSTTITFHYNTSPVSVQGLQTMAMAAGAINRQGDGSGMTAFSASFRYDALPMQVTSTTPANGSSVVLPFTTLDVTFNEAYDPASIGATDLTLNQGSVVSSAVVNSTTVRYTLSGINVEGTLTVNMAAGALNDAFGNPMSAYSGSFILDVGLVPFPVPLADQLPQGSLIYSGASAGTIGIVGDTDSFTINVDAGQAITVMADPAGALLTTVELRDPSNTLIASSTSAAAGKDAILQSIPVGAGGVYTITVSGAASTTGAYALQVMLNASLENESVDGPTDDTQASAQNIDSSFISLGGGGERGAVLGSLPTTTGVPVVSETFESGSLGAAWSTYSSDATNGRIQVTGAYGTAGGAFAMVMDHNDSTGATYNLNEAIWTVNLAGLTQASLAFSAANYNDEVDTLPTTFTGHTNGDGVAISPDGVTWRTVWQATSTAQGVYSPITVDLAAAALAGGFTLGANFKIKFQQYDNFNLTTDGRAWDNITITTPAAADDWYSLTLAAGDSTTVALKSFVAGAVDAKLVDASGTTLAWSSTTSTNVTNLITDFMAPTSGTYYVRVSGSSGGNYSLTVMCNAEFDTETNDTRATAQRIQSRLLSGTQVVLGDIGGTTNSILNFSELPEQPIDGLSYGGIDFGFSVDGAPSDDAIFGATSDAVTTQLDDKVLEGNASGVLTLTFDQPTTHLSFDLGLEEPVSQGPPPVGGDPEEEGQRDFLVRLYDAKGSLLDTQRVLAFSRQQAELFESTYSYDGEAVSQVQIDFDQDPDVTFALDNLSVLSGNTVDTYAVPLAAGAVLQVTTSTPGDGAGEFVNTFNPRLRLLNSAGTQLALDDNSAGDGRNALLTYTVPVGGDGTYFVEVSSTTVSSTIGEYSLQVSGATGALPAFAVASTNPANGALLGAAPTQITVSLNDALLQTSLQASDLTVDGIAATAFTVVNASTVTFTLAPGLGEGMHSVAFAAGSLVDLQGTPLTAYSGQFTIDLTSPRINSSSIQQGDFLATGNLSYVVGFNEPMNKTNLDSTDFTLLGVDRNISYTASSFSYDAAGTTLTLNYAGLPEDRYTLTLLSAAGRFADLVGNNLDGEAVSWPIPPNVSGNGVSGGNFVVQFSTDSATSGFPTPLTSQAPAGSLIYNGATLSDITSAVDSDTFTLSLDAGQTISLVATPTSGSTLQPILTLKSPANVVLGSQTAGAAGQSALLQTIPITATGSYSIILSGASGTLGMANILVILNAAVDAEGFNGPTNNTLATAQNIDGGFSSLGGTASRGGVSGGMTSAENDFYSLSLVAGQANTVGLKILTGTGASISIQNGSGAVLASGVAGFTNLDQVIGNFVAPTTGTFYIVVSGTAAATYDLVVTRNAEFNTETNDTQATAQTLALSGTVLGFAGGSSLGTGPLLSGATDLTGTPLSLGIAADGSFVGPTLGAKWNGVEFLRIGTFLATFTIGYNGQTFTNASAAGDGTAFPVTMQNLSSGTTHAIRIDGNPQAGVSFQRLVSWKDGDNFALVQTTLTNSTGATLANVALLDNQDPDPGGTIATNNDVTSGGQLVAGSAAAGAMALGSADSRRVVSAEGFFVSDPFAIINSPVDPNGANADIALNLAFNLGSLAPGASTTTTFAMVFGATQAAVESTYSAMASQTLASTKDSDFYQITLNANANFQAGTTTPGDGSGEPVNLLDPRLRLFNAAGSVVASDDNSAADGRNALLNYTVPAGQGGTYFIEVAASPATSSPTSGEYVLNVSGLAPANHAPLLDNNGSPTLTTITEDPVTNPGTLISTMLATGAGGNPISDADPGALQGIALTGVDATHGTWQFTTDGTNWLAVGSPSDASALLLAADANTRLRFLPNANFNGSVSSAITFRAWDQTVGGNGGTGNASINGGISAFSSATETAALQITPVNDVPIANAQTTTATGPIVLTLSGDDGDPEVTQALTFAILNGLTHGTLSGFNPTTGQVTYMPSGNFTGNDAFTFTITDDGTAGGPPLTSLPATVTINTPVTVLPISIASPRDMVFDPLRHLLYITSGTNVQRYDVTTNTLLSPIVVGGSLGGLDITPDGSALYIADGQTVGSQGFIRKVDLATNVITNLPYTLAFSELGAFDVNIASNGLAFFSTNFNGSGWTPFRQIDLATGVISIRTDTHGSGSPGQVRQSTDIYRSPDRSKFVMFEQNISSGPVFTYNAGTNTFSAGIQTNEFYTSFAISRDDAEIAWESWSGSIKLLNTSLTVVNTINGPNAGVAFDPTRDVLYAANSTTDQFVAYNSNTGQQIFTAPIGIAIGAVNTAVDAMTVSDDGKFLFLTTANDVRVLPLGQFFSATANQPPSFIKGPDQTVNEDVGAKSVPGWATAISQGAGDSGQLLNFIVSNGNNSLFSVEPAISSDGTLTYTPAPNANGSTTVTVQLHDNGGTANGGFDTSAAQTFVVTVNSVNDVPGFTKGADQGVLEDAGTQSVPGWATAISAGPANESGQALNFLVTNTNSSLFSTQPVISSSGGLTYTPAANANGSATVTVQLHDSGGTANGGIDTSAPQTFVINVTAVNDPPSFTKGSDQTVLAGAGAQSVPGWATAISAGPADESNQALNFIVSNDNNSLFSMQPAISSNGTLTYTPAPNANGSTTVTVQLHDNGGTANGGVDTSAAQTFTINVTSSVNVVPSFVEGSDQSVLEDAGVQTVLYWATAISAGPPNESGQALNFLVTNTNGSLFSVQPTVSSSGTLTYTPAANANGSATVTVQLHDSGGTAIGGIDTSAPQTFVINVTAVNDPPSFTKGSDQTVLASAGAQSVPGWATAISAGPANESNQALNFIVSNDNNSLFSTQPAISSNGTLTYTPAPNANGSTTVTVQLHDNGGTANGGIDTSTPQTFIISLTTNPIVPGNPIVLSLSAMNPPAGDASSVDYTATFSRPVTGVESTDFALVKTGTVAATLTQVTQVSSTVYTVTISGITGTGTLGLNLVDNGSIRDASGNGLVQSSTPLSIGNQHAYAAGNTPKSIQVNDINGDGKPDLVVADFGEAKVSVLLGSGSGTFPIRQTFTVGTKPGSVSEADLNGDNKMDLVVTNFNDNTVGILLGNGDGTFQPQQTYSTGAHPFSAAIADFNHDNNLDIAVINSIDKTVGLLLGNGNGTFQPQTTFTPGLGGITIITADFNGDGKPDLAIAGASSDGSMGGVLLGNGDGTFQPQRSFSTGTNAWGAAAADVNGDGKLDLVIPSQSTNAVDVLLGNGDGTFQTQRAFSTGMNPTSVAVGDINGDGKPDLLVANTSQNTVSLLLGNGDGTFQPQQTFTTGTTPYSVAIADLNGDGKPDLAVANGSTATASVLLNTANGNFTGQVYTFTAHNHPPQGTNNTVTVLEDTPFAFATSSFGFSDPNDSPSNNLAAVLITTLPAAGTLTDNNVAVTTGQFIPVADITANQLRFTPASNVNGTAYASFTFQVQDDGGTANGGVNLDPTPRSMTINVTAVNDAPSFTKGADQAVLEDAGAQSVSGWATSISFGPPNESGQVLNFLVSNTNSSLFSSQPSISSGGTLIYTAAANANGSATVTVQLHDNGGTANGGVDTSAAQTFTINVTAVNDVPSFVKGSDQTVLEDAGTQNVSGWAAGISAGPPDEAGQALNFLVTNTNSSLFLVQPAVSSTGTLTYTPAANANGSSTVTVQIHDNGGTANNGLDTSAAQTFIISITAVNDVPSFVKGSDQTVLEDAGAQSVSSWATGISAGPSDESGQALNFLVTNTNSSLFSVQPGISSNGTLTYTPAANANGSATVTVQIHDNGGTANSGVDTSAAQTFVITVNPVNDMPSFTKGADQGVLEDAGAQSVPGWATAISAGPANESGQTLNFLVTNTNSSLFSVQPGISSNGTLTYTPAGNANGNATVTVQIHDNGGTANGGVDTSAAQTFVITVTAVNDAPSFTKGSDQTVLEDAGAQSVPSWATAISVGPADESGQALNFLVTNTNSSLFSAQPAISSTGTLTYTPAANANGSATVTVQIHDNGGTANSGLDTSAAQTFVITVNSVNDVPSFTKGADQGVLEDAGAQSVTGWATAISAGPANESGQTLNFLVSNTNSSLFSVQPGISSNGTLTYTPAGNANGNATVTVQIHDNGGTANAGVDTSAAQTFVITVNPVNDVPSFTKGADQGILEDAGAQSVPGWATAISAGPANESGQALNFLVTNTNSSLFSVQPGISSSGTLTYTPAGNANGSATVTVQIHDNGGTANSGVDTSAAQTFTINITAVNDVPSFTKGADQGVLEDAGAQSVTGWATAISSGPANESGQTLNFLVTNTNSSLFSVQPGISSNGTLTYTPAGNANGSATVTVQIHDNGGTANAGVDTSAAQTFTITVNPVNDVPSFTKGADQGVLEDAGAQSVPGWATAISAGPADESGQTHNFLVTNTNSSLFSVQPTISSSGTLTYTPAANANGSATVTVQIHDNGGTANSGLDTSLAETFTINVTAVNDVPSFTKGADQGVLEDAGAQSVPGWATAISAGPANESGQTLNFLVTNTNSSLFSVQPTVSSGGTLTYTPAANANGTATVTVQIHDNGGTANGGIDTSAAQTFVINVTSVNDAPSFSKGPDQTVNEDSGAASVSGWATGISAGPSDEAGQTLTFVTTVGPVWGSYAGGPQHTANSPVASQALQAIHWQTPVDQHPQYSGNDLLIHYGTPLVTAANTIIVPVKTGTTDGFELDAINGADGTTKWTQATDYTLPSHNWTPSYSPVLTPQGRLYYAGAGGTVYYRDNVDGAGAVAPVQLAFYGLANYTANPSGYNSSVFIDTPLTSDSAGNIYFGFHVAGSNPSGLTSGIARISASGTGTYVSATAAGGDSGLTEAMYNAAPALSIDGSMLYVAVSSGDFGRGSLVALDSATLSPLARVALKDPNSGNDALLPNDGTASPMVGPDGDVYFGVLESPFPSNHDRGWLLHFSSDLSQTKVPGAFGWDDTPSVVPASMVPSYMGSSTYLLMTKYNNYAGVGGDGVNKLAILDPNASMTDPITGATVMKEVLTIAGMTPDTEFTSSLPNAVREWCINTAVVDQATDSVLVNSEDGRLYRWNLTANSFTQSITLTSGIGEAYTPTLIGADGTVYAINNATLFAVGLASPATFSGLFATPPSINPVTGNLTYQVANNVVGTFTINVQLHDNGGTANGSIDTSAAQTFVINVTSVNDAPSFTKGAEQTVNEDSAAASVSGWATSISAGPPDEAGQALNFLVTNTNSGLFSTQPFISSDGTLTYTPAANANGSATVTVQLHDNGGIANSGVDTSASQSFVISVTTVNDTPSFTKGSDPTVNEDSGAASLSGWATAISAGPPDEAGQAVNFLVTNTNSSLFSVQPTVSSDGTLTYTPALNANGTATVSVQIHDDGGTANGGIDTSATQTFIITINPVNDAPTFVKGSDQTILEDAGAQNISGWATAISAGPADESGQALNFLVTNTNSSMFLTQPAISSDGTLSYTPAANANGSATITVQLHDDGGTVNGGVDTSAVQTFVITVNAVNDPPSFTLGADQTVSEDAGAQTISGWATAISAGPPDEAGQALELLVTNTNSSLFLMQPSISSDGALTYTPAVNANGSATVIVQLHDDGGTALGGVDTSLVQTFSIFVTAVNDPPTDTDNTITMAEDSAYTFASNDFGFSDPYDAPSNDLLAVKIATLPVAGSLLDHGSPVATGQFVSLVDIANEWLQFIPASNQNGAAYASFSFQVQDDGGIEFGGIDLDPSPHTLSINITSVNDAPSFAKGADQTVLEDSGPHSVSSWAGSISAGPSDEAAQGIDFLVSNDRNDLFSSQPAISSNGTLTYTPVANANGSATITVQIHDNGGTANVGVDTSAPQTFVINITGINDAPSGANNTVAAVEDTAYIFTATDFPLTDNNDVPANKLRAVKIDTLPAAGSLSDNGVALTAGTTILLADFTGNKVKFTPAANAFGTSYASFTFQVQDDGGTTSGGMDLDPTPKTLTIDVAAVDDVPSFTKGANQTFLEDSGAHTISNWATALSAGPANEAGQARNFLVSNNNNPLFSTQPAVSSTGTLTFTLAPNANGSSTVNVQLHDNGGTANGGIDTSAIQTFTINVTSVNDAPSGTTSTLTATEDTAYTFSAASFGFTDPNDAPANSLLAVKITTLPGIGSLTDNGTAVTAGKVIPVADVTGSKLKFMPVANAFGTNYTSFTFQVQDNGGTASGGVDTDPTPNTITFNVTSVNDVPSFTKGANQTALEDSGAHSVANWATAISAGPANEASQTRNFLVSNNNNALFSTQPAVSSTGTLTFTLAPNKNGSATVSVQLHDNGGTANGGIDTSAIQTFTINVTSVNDAPSGTNGTLTATEDTAYTFSAASFGFTDPNDAPANSLLAVKITTLPGIGSLTDNGTAVTAGTVIPVADVTGSKLKFMPVANAFGTNYTSFTFQVQDNGGTASGGVDTDPTPNTITFNVTSVNDVPSFTKGANQTALEDSGAHSVANWATAISAGPANEASQALNFIVSNNNNSLFSSQPAISSNGTLTYTPAPNANGSATVSVKVHDNGGTAGGGVDTSAVQTYTISLTAVNDAPIFTAGASPAVNMNSGTQTVPNWATSIADGPSNEIGQALNFIVSNNNNGLFSTQPAISSVGTLTFTPKANAVGTATVTVQLHDNGGTANGGKDTSAAQTFTISVFDSRAFDFEAASSLQTTAFGYTSVLGSTLFSTTTGFGWQAAVSSFDRTGTNALLRDGNYGADGTFKVNLPDGTYVVNVTMGDSLVVHGNTDIYAEGTLVLHDQSEPAGQFLQRSFVVNSTGGQLALRFKNDGGADGNFAIDALEIVPQASAKAITIPASLGTSPANGTTVTPVSAATTLPDGSIVTVQTSLGSVVNAVDSDSLRMGTQVVVSGGQVTFGLTSTSLGTATVTLEEVTGKAIPATASITFTPPTTRLFDFDAAALFTQTDYSSVRGSDLYTDTLGYGWLAAASEFDSGSFTLDTTLNPDFSAAQVPLLRDGDWGTDDTFRILVDQSSPSYTVTVDIGDATNGRSVNVYAEGNFIATVTTAVGQFQVLSFVVPTSQIPATGYLDIRFTNGPDDSYFVVNGLSMATPALALPSPMPSDNGAALTDQELAPIVQQAITRWTAAGLSATAEASLEQVKFQIEHLVGASYLGMAQPGLVQIDDAAAGYGWFVDPTPASDAEFTQPVASSELRAAPGTIAASHIDLLTVVMHELGHELGLPDLDPGAHPYDLMAELITTGVRRLPLPVSPAILPPVEAITPKHLMAVASAPSLSSSTASNAVFALFSTPASSGPMLPASSAATLPTTLPNSTLPLQVEANLPSLQPRLVATASSSLDSRIALRKTANTVDAVFNLLGR